ncbi:hypothetical protein OH76DRAFT_1186780 [Lentinus brumalis]|uniref:Uncharacterized protein n=1 Tax=Lentinus brumalis TaxID=2498619 RepID=A0A371CTQ7_9APHY|nr:hypothetical protein OH76DRAFT_1186780 [Polyporus brumalis]
MGQEERGGTGRWTGLWGQTQLANSATKQPRHATAETLSLYVGSSSSLDQDRGTCTTHRSYMLHRMRCFQTAIFQGESTSISNLKHWAWQGRLVHGVTVCCPVNTRICQCHQCSSVVWSRRSAAVYVRSSAARPRLSALGGRPRSDKITPSPCMPAMYGCACDAQSSLVSIILGRGSRFMPSPAA